VLVLLDVMVVIVVVVDLVVLVVVEFVVVVVVVLVVVVVVCSGNKIKMEKYKQNFWYSSIKILNEKSENREEHQITQRNISNLFIVFIKIKLGSNIK
jgi:Flp pilus assembly protein TadB